MARFVTRLTLVLSKKGGNGPTLQKWVKPLAPEGSRSSRLVTPRRTSQLR